MIDELAGRGLTYERYCSRRDILQAPRAPHAPEGAYRDLPRSHRRRTADRRAGGRPPALRLRAEVGEYTVTDVLHGSYTGGVDDLVLRRGDGVPAYNLAVVVDDAAQGVDQVVRGDDLLSSSPGRPTSARCWATRTDVRPRPAGPQRRGKRLAKRDGAVTMAEIGAGHALSFIAGSLGFPPPRSTECSPISIRYGYPGIRGCSKP